MYNTSFDIYSMLKTCVSSVDIWLASLFKKLPIIVAVLLILKRYPLKPHLQVTFVSVDNNF